MNWYNRHSDAELVKLASLNKEAGTFSSALLFAVALLLSGFDPADASEVTKTSPQAVSQAAKNPEARERAKLLLDFNKMRGMSNEQKRAYLDSLKGIPQQTAKRAVPVKNPAPAPKQEPAKSKEQVKAPVANISKIVSLVLQHEGLIPGQTPFRITSPKMRTWSKIYGYQIDKSPDKSQGRKNFIFLENPADVPKAVMALFKMYRDKPSKYQLPANPTLKQAIEKFDQSGAAGKIKFLKDHVPGLNINEHLKDFFVQ